MLTGRGITSVRLAHEGKGETLGRRNGGMSGQVSHFLVWMTWWNPNKPA